jgi:hypothetical protein
MYPDVDDYRMYLSQALFKSGMYAEAEKYAKNLNISYILHPPPFYPLNTADSSI